MDKEGIVFGILLSLIVQGFYGMIFYAIQVRYVEEIAAMIATFGTFAVFYGVLRSKGYFERREE